MTLETLPTRAEHVVPFEPQIRDWFDATHGQPTDIQRRSWPAIARGDHVALTAPTGSGKTLTAFLWALNAFARGTFETGATRVLYVSPLKALNNDIRKNLLEPLHALRQAGEFPDVHVKVRSGDTPSSDRQRMLRRPPEILITTPESLTLLLSTARGRHALGSVRTVILDEIHALIENRRGVMLMSSIERLAWTTGEFQRIALSATVNPLDTVAAYVGGLMPDRTPRPVTQIASDASKEIEFRVRFPPAARQAAGSGKHVWEGLTDSFRELISRNSSTLFFTNSRRLAEKIALKINQDEAEPIAYAHHGSLAREIRTEVETRLKSGDLRAIVATSSLEMGIDIGHLDEVVLVQSPGSIASALQRIGRAGHRVGETSRGTLYPTHAKDFLEAAALAEAIRERAIEPLRPIENPLDVLAQVIVSATAGEAWPIDELYRMVTCCYPYRTLTREHFDLVVEMLTGRYAGARLRDLNPRLSLDRVRGTLEATKGAVLSFYAAGGTIPDRGYYQLRHAESGQPIGELDEEFVWEAHIGQVLSFGSQRWQIHRITHNDVLARPAKPGSSAPPFWRAEGVNRSFHYSSRIGAFLESCEALLANTGEQALADLLRESHGFEPDPAAELVDFLVRQRTATRAPLPHRHHLLVEDIATGPAGYRGSDGERQVVLHTHWGARLNRPLALALQAVWRRRHGVNPEIHADNDAIIIQHKGEANVEGLILEVRSDHLDDLLRGELEGSGFFGARFRECAGRALVLAKRRFNHRVPLWMTRQNAKKLLSATRAFPDFPVILESWRTCLVDEFELDALRGVLDEIADGTIALTRVATPAPSPFAVGLAWEQINRYMYADDTPEQAAPSALDDQLIRNAVHDEALRPRLDPAIAERFRLKRQRLEPGYAPRGARELADWLKERVAIPEPEWRELCAMVDADALPEQDLEWLRWQDRRWATHRENTRHLLRELLGQADPASRLPEIDDGRDAPQLIREILSFYGPVRTDLLDELLPCPPEIRIPALSVLLDEGGLVCAPLVAGDDAEYGCDADNLEALFRFQRAARRRDVEPRPLTELPGFLARWQGFGRPPEGPDVDAALDRLRGFPAAVAVWLDELVSARFPDADPRILDDGVATGELRWVGCGREQVTFAPAGETDLVRDAPTPFLASAFRDPDARYAFSQLTDRLAREGQEPSLERGNDALWEAVWAGEISADSVAPLRHGWARRFRLSAAPRPPRRGMRRRIDRPRGWPGNWMLLRYAAATDALDALELTKERARILLDRYGVVTREIANRDGGVFAWKHLFRAFRVMELGGEVSAGMFFTGLSGPQFAVPAAVRRLGDPANLDGYWLNATDPAAPTGLGIDWPELELPQRRATSHLAFNAGRLILVSERSGARLRCAAELGDDDIEVIVRWLEQQVARHGRLRVEEIDGAPAVTASLVSRLHGRSRVLQVEQDHRSVELTRAVSAYTSAKD